jgi:hypothetical protein
MLEIEIEVKNEEERKKRDFSADLPSAMISITPAVI